MSGNMNSGATDERASEPDVISEDFEDAGEPGSSIPEPDVTKDRDPEAETVSNEDPPGEQREMPLYNCHKLVRALKILRVEDGLVQGGAVLIFERDGYPPREVSAEYMVKHAPEPHGYYVRYGDGYVSYSPGWAFEGGYTEAETVSDGIDEPAPVSEDRVFHESPDGEIVGINDGKFGINMIYELCNIKTGEPIPHDEPVFVLRGKDVLAEQVLAYYLTLIGEPGHKAAVRLRVNDFQIFRDSNPDRMRMPT